MALDTNFASVTLLLHGDGVNGATTFPDSSRSRHSVTIGTGTPTIATAQSVFGGASISTGTVMSLDVPGGCAEFGTGDFTVELWIRPNSVGSTQQLFTRQGAAGMALQLYLYSPGKIGGLLRDTSGADLVNYQSSTVAVSATTWVHVAMVRISGVVTIYVGGVGNTPTAGTQDLVHATEPARIAALTAGGAPTQEFQGYIDDVRVTTGVGRYTTDFIPPIAPFPDAENETAFSAPMQTLVAYGGASASVLTATPTLVAYLGGFAAVSAPSATFYAGVVQHATVEMVAPMQTLTSDMGGHCLVSPPTPRLAIAGHAATGDNDVSFTAQMQTLVAHGGGNVRVTVPMQTLEASGSTSQIATVSVTAPSATLTASGYGGAVGAADLTLATPYSLIGYGGAVCSVTLTGHPTVQATGMGGSLGVAQITAPLFELVASGTAQNHGSVEIIAPMAQLSATLRGYVVAPMARLVAIGTATVTATYEAYAVNLKHTSDKSPDEVTRYTNFPFTHIVRYQNSYFGANETGLYLLEGTTDYAATPTAIPWAWKTAMTDFGYPEFKTIESIYFGGRLGRAETITLYAGEGAQTQAYHYTTPRGELAQNYRQKMGKGIRDHRYYALGANGSGELELDTADFNIAKRTRRI